MTGKQLGHIWADLHRQKSGGVGGHIREKAIVKTKCLQQFVNWMLLSEFSSEGSPLTQSRFGRRGFSVAIGTKVLNAGSLGALGDAVLA